MAHAIYIQHITHGTKTITLHIMHTITDIPCCPLLSSSSHMTSTATAARSLVQLTVTYLSARRPLVDRVRCLRMYQLQPLGKGHSLCQIAYSTVGLPHLSNGIYATEDLWGKGGRGEEEGEHCKSLSRYQHFTDL